jgi:hypothetical protein
MAYQAVLGPGPLYPEMPFAMVLPPIFASITIDATGEKAAFSGPVFFPSRTGSKNARRVHIRFGTIAKGGGSGLTISLQNVNLTAGPPLQPDETQDQTVAVANGDAGFASNTWYRSNALSADRSVAYGEMLSIVVEFDGSGRLGSDSVTLSGLQADYTGPWQTCSTALKTASWAASSIIPNVLLEFDDGTFGTLLGAAPISDLGTILVNLDTAGSDEYANEIVAPYPMQVDGLWGFETTAQDCELLLYLGTAVQRTITIDGNAMTSTASRPHRRNFAPYDIPANTTVRVAFRPTVASNITLYRIDVNDANHWSVWPGGTTCALTSRLNSGAWAAVTATRRLLAGVQQSGFDNGAGASGGGGPLIRGRLVR